jgi:hypothetical protein
MTEITNLKIALTNQKRGEKCTLMKKFAENIHKEIKEKKNKLKKMFNLTTNKTNEN